MVGARSWNHGRIHSVFSIEQTAGAAVGGVSIRLYSFSRSSTIRWSSAVNRRWGGLEDDLHLRQPPADKFKRALQVRDTPSIPQKSNR